jgi:large subunit ribosomal protein L5
LEIQRKQLVYDYGVQMTNPMREIKIEKITLNVGTGKDQKNLERGMLLIKHVTGMEPVKAITQKRIAGWGLRPGLPIGAKLTIRGEKAGEILQKLIEARDGIIPLSCFDNHGNISFGLKEYIDIPDVEYNPEIKMMGFQVSVTLARAGFRIKKRRIFTKKIPKSHAISKEDSMNFMEQKYKIKFGEDEE